MAVAPDLEPPVTALGGDIEALVVDAARDGSSPTRSEVEAAAAFRLLKGAAGVGPADVMFPVVGVEGEALDIDVEVEAAHFETELRAQRSQQVLKGGHGLGRSDSVDELGTGLYPKSRKEGARGGSEMCIRDRAGPD